jgi:hypothetical protein
VKLKVDKPVNENYAATVVSIKSITPLEGCDNVVGSPIFGFQAVVGKDTQPGDLGIVFPAETQLSDEYARENNLHRHGDRNKDEGAKGYLEDNRRIRAIKFRGHRSDCLFMPLTSLAFTGVKIADLNEGDTFDTLNGHDICKKYEVVRKAGTPRTEKNKLKFVRVDKKFMPEHYDSDNYFRNRHVIPGDREVIVTQKIHGTSIRIGHTIVARKPRLVERLANLLGARIANTEYDYVFGSRKVIKDINNPNQNHFYSTDIWTEEGKRLEGLLPEGFIVYGELIGWTSNGAPIQKNYTYRVPQGAAELYVYRIAQVNPQGRVTDLSWDQTTELCRDLGLKHVPELWRGKMADFVAEDWIDKTFSTEFSGVVPLDEASPCDEGVCIRVDGLAPYILKAKSPLFFEHETRMLDEEALDLEAEGSVA